MKELLSQLVSGQSLSVDQSVDAFEQIMTGRAGGAQIAALLALIQQRGPTVEEITGAAKVMRDKVLAVAVPAGLTVIDTCGTGADDAQTFNVSTASALVAAAAARPHDVAVAKHGNRSVTSRSGSSQVLEALGVKLNVTGETHTQCLAEAGICFCFAPMHHPAMKHAMPVRLELGFRTLFNVLGPLTNPAGAKRQLMGVFDAAMTQKLAEVLKNLGSEHAMVVHGRIEGGGGLDELSICGPSEVAHLHDGSVRRYEIDPTTLHLAVVDPSRLQVDSTEASSLVIRGVLGGEQGPARDIVRLNAAAALHIAGIAQDLSVGLELSTHAIDSGKAAQALQQLVTITQADATSIE